MNNRITIDFIDNIDVDSKYFINQHQLTNLKAGLDFIFNQTKYIQDNPERFGTPKFVTEAEFLMNPYLSDLVACFFQWFSVSIVSYVKLVGLLRYLDRNKLEYSNITLLSKDILAAMKREINAYINSVIPDIKLWRDKVGAHFAMADPFDNDNIVTMEDSLMTQIYLVKGKYTTHLFHLNFAGKSSVIPEWSIVNIYENVFKSRYLNL